MYAALSEQEFALMLLSVCTVDPDETLGFVLGFGKLDAEFLADLFEMCDCIV
jgi:hypothetical protein